MKRTILIAAALAALTLAGCGADPAPTPSTSPSPSLSASASVATVPVRLEVAGAGIASSITVSGDGVEPTTLTNVALPWRGVVAARPGATITLSAAAGTDSGPLTVRVGDRSASASGADAVVEVRGVAK